MTLTDVLIEDLYPTRIAARQQPIARKHPTVWGSEADGPMDAAALGHHDSQGFTTVDDLLSPDEVQQYWQELRRLSRNTALDGDERVITEKSSGEVRSIFDVHVLSDVVAALVCDPRVLGRAQQILGSDVYVHQSRVNYMSGITGTGFFWHSDFETWHAEDGMPAPRAVSCSIALTDNYPFNGGLMVMPGSHCTYVPCVGETPQDNYKQSLKDQEVGVPSNDDIIDLAAEHGIEQFTGPAGSAFWFDSNIMHGSGNNITPFPRSNIFVVFNSVDNALVDPYAGTTPRPNFIAHRDPAPLR